MTAVANVVTVCYGLAAVLLAAGIGRYINRHATTRHQPPPPVLGLFDQDRHDNARRPTCHNQPTQRRNARHPQ